jgi:hypothetical protein
MSAQFAVAQLLTGLGLPGLDPQNDSGLFTVDHGSLEGFKKWQSFGIKPPKDGRNELNARQSH